MFQTYLVSFYYHNAPIPEMVPPTMITAHLLYIYIDHFKLANFNICRKESLVCFLLNVAKLIFHKHFRYILEMFFSFEGSCDKM